LYFARLRRYSLHPSQRLQLSLWIQSNLSIQLSLSIQ